MMPLQKLEKSCRPTNWLMTMIARPLGRTVVGSSASGASSAAFAGEEMSSSDGPKAEGALPALPDGSPKDVNSTEGPFDISYYLHPRQVDDVGMNETEGATTPFCKHDWFIRDSCSRDLRAVPVRVMRASKHVHPNYRLKLARAVEARQVSI
jgi:hypothetical protein